ncbi:hypothetical protein ANN_14948, partial [Periplaneta americana]
MENVTPKCPVPPGSYAFHDHKLEWGPVDNIPGISGYWIMKTEGFLGKDRVMCVLTEMNFVRKRVKSGK